MMLEIESRERGQFGEIVKGVFVVRRKSLPVKQCTIGRVMLIVEDAILLDRRGKQLFASLLVVWVFEPEQFSDSIHLRFLSS